MKIRKTEDVYRGSISWDSVARSTHCVDCMPGNCPYYVFVKDGAVVGSEPIGAMAPVENGLPDLNPLGCQKGAAWHLLLDGKERVLHPLKRAGERGEGKWQQVSWDQALTEIADHLIDAIEEIGPESIIHEGTPAEGGLLTIGPFGRLAGLLGATRTDVNAVINDDSPGTYLTYGKFDPVLSMDDLYHAELVIYAHTNPAYTMIPTAHVASEARYRGTEIVLVAPDTSPSHTHADYFVPIRPGTDAAFALAMAQVIIEEGLYNAKFVSEQTDLPLLVRRDNQRFLRESDMVEGGRDDQFYVWDSRKNAPVPAPRDTLALSIKPLLTGDHSVRLKDGTPVAVAPVFEIVSRTLQQYTPEAASAISGVHPDVVRTLARKVASKRTTLLCGATAQKYYHGDLMLRAYLLVLGLTGNWGRQGAGSCEWSTAGFDGPFMYGMKQGEGGEAARQVVALKDMMAAAIKQQDPTMTDEMAHIGLMERMAASGAAGAGTPPAFLWYYHWGFAEDWNRREWNDPAMTRSFDAYVEESIDSGWWQGVTHPGPNYPPRVYLEVGGNALRRTRGGRKRLLRSLWPQLKCIVSVDWRMSTTALSSDYVLPAAHHFEKVTFQFPSPWLMNLTMGDRIVEPAGDSRTEVSISLLLAQKVQERARAREVLASRDAAGAERRLDDFADQYTGGGKLWLDEEQIAREWVEDSAATGSLPPGTTLDTLRERGHVRFTGWGNGPSAFSQSSDIKADETHSPFRWHVEDKIPYPTLTRRAQFYIDHPWFIEADEALPRHKENPPQGGDYPFMLTSGHSRWSIHSMNITDKLLLQTHRGAPHVVINDNDAARLGIGDGEDLEMRNDLGSFVVAAKVSPSVRPGQVISYNGWEPYMYASWDAAADLDPGMVKWLHFAGGYGHLRYRPLQWQPVPFDRGVRVDIRRASDPRASESQATPGAISAASPVRRNSR